MAFLRSRFSELVCAQEGAFVHFRHKRNISKAYPVEPRKHIWESFPMTAPRRHEQAGTMNRFTPQEIRSFVEQDKRKKSSQPGQESRAKAKPKPPTFKGIKFPDLAKKGTRPAVAKRSAAHPSVANAIHRLDIITKSIKP